jgi:adenylate cyclase
MVVGIERIWLAIAVAAIGVSLVITLELSVPRDTGAEPPWFVTVGFVVNTIGAGVLAVAMVWYGLRQIASAEAAMEQEYQRSETLLANILPASIATRLKDRSNSVIADKYEDASILFADIGGYTERASDTSPEELVAFLDDLYTSLDALVTEHDLEKVKTSGDAYMVVSGVPQPRHDHLEALADLALYIANAVAGLTDSRGRAVPLRIGMASGPVVAGVVGSQRFFYDVWGDAVNVASRMESTVAVGRIQVPQPVYQRLRGHFVFEERGDVEVKGKGVMHTWYLVGRNDGRPDPAAVRVMDHDDPHQRIAEPEAWNDSRKSAWGFPRNLWNGLVMAFRENEQNGIRAGKSVLDVRVHNGTAYTALSVGKEF